MATVDSPDEAIGVVIDGPNDPGSVRSACTECSRRKQKCNREWPCNHCQKRKVPDQCRFKDLTQPNAEKTAREKRRKRRLANDNDNDNANTNANGGAHDSDGSTSSDGIDALGYMPSHVLYGMTAPDETIKASSREYTRDPRTCPQLERALQVIPPRPYTDTLVQNFLQNVNFHYYIIYPPTFLEQYQKWWTDRAASKPLCVQWTCLLLTVCACASQYTDLELQRKLEIDLGDTVQRLTEQYQESARELSTSIPIGYSHLVNVQQLLHSCYWFKSEARFVECWHVLNSAIREAQELGMHKESTDDPIPDFELEIRRRVWCVMDTWDWQISALLGRPMIIDRADCSVELPNLQLEGTQHSPLTHMKLQSGLIRQLFGRFGLTKNVATPAEVQEYQGIVEQWVNDFPPPFDVRDPDKSLDESCPWIVLHRHYIRTMAFSMLLDPIRSYLARAFNINSTDAELQIRRDGINYCLELMVSLHGFFDHVYPRDAKFHFVLFCIFDTSTVLCSAVFHDEHHTLPRRDDVFKAIDEAHAMLQRLNTVTKSARQSYGILSRIVQRLPRTAMPKTPERNPAAKRVRVTEVPILTQTVDPKAISQPLTVSPLDLMAAPEAPALPNASSIPGPAPYVEWQHADSVPIVGAAADGSGASTVLEASVAEEPIFDAPVLNDPFPELNFPELSEQELGELVSMWNYESLDFGFLSEPLLPSDT